MLGLDKVATALVAPARGVLAADESMQTTSKRLDAVGAAPSADTRRDYQRLLLTTPGTGSVPPAEAPIASLAGGKSGERACVNLAAVNAHAVTDRTAPWRLTPLAPRVTSRIHHGDVPAALPISRERRTSRA